MESNQQQQQLYSNNLSSHKKQNIKLHASVLLEDFDAFKAASLVLTKP